jgi:hypothetical protein
MLREPPHERNFLDVSLGMVEIPRPLDGAASGHDSGEVKVRHAGERLHQCDGQCPSYRWKTVSRLIKGMGMDPGFHRGDDKAGMNEAQMDSR